MRSVVRIERHGKSHARAGEAEVRKVGLQDVDSRVEIIQALIPLGLQAVNELLVEEVGRLAGPRYSRAGGQPGYGRWGSQVGSVYLGEQKVSVTVPRVRDKHRGQEVPLAAYHRLQNARRADDAAVGKILKGLSCRDYASCVDAVPETFGLSSSTLSRRFKRASAKKLAELAERDLSGYDIVGLFLDGKTFGDDRMVIALGVTVEGNKVILGFVQTATENARVCTRFLRDLLERGLCVDSGVLCVIDGGKGLRKAIETVLGSKAAVQRCQWHKRENVLGYLPTGRQASFRRKLQHAYEKPTYAQAKAALRKVRSELDLINQSAVASLDEGFEETLTLHRLGLFKELGTSFKTTNCIENLNSLVEDRTGKVDAWKNSEQKHRWLATALLDIEPRMRRVRGYRHLAQLRSALQKHLEGVLEEVA